MQLDEGAGAAAAVVAAAAAVRARAHACARLLGKRDQRAVDVHVGGVVHDHGDAATKRAAGGGIVVRRPMREQMIQEGRFAAAEESREEGHGEARVVHVIIELIYMRARLHVWRAAVLAGPGHHCALPHGVFGPRRGY